MEKHLRFNMHVGRDKPYTIDDGSVDCPFCDRGQLSGILDEEGPIILLKNKFPVLEDTYQTVLIETDQCQSELSLYPKDHLYTLMHFAVDRWQRMIHSGEFASVLFYKNHGPYSGGSIRHPHMQIVGLQKVDYRPNVQESDFQGLIIAQEPGVEFNLSTQPRVGFTEFNVILTDMSRLPRLADYVQVAAHYVLHHFNTNAQSYNLFLYEFGDGIAAKLIPRFIVGPLYVGFSIPQVSNRLEEIVTRVREQYFPLESGTTHDSTRAVR